MINRQIKKGKRRILGQDTNTTTRRKEEKEEKEEGKTKLENT